MSAAPVRRVPDEERRARLARRQGLAPGCAVADAVAAADACLGLHATEPGSVHLAALARTERLTAVDVDRALHEDRTLVKALVMRRTLFAVTREQLPVVTAVASARVAHGERRTLVREIVLAGAAERLHASIGAAEAGGPGAAGDDAALAGRWLEATGDAVVAVLADGVPRTLAELRAAVPALDVRVPQGTGRWAVDRPVSTRVMAWLSARGLVARSGNDAHWRVARHRWTGMDAWAGAPEPEAAEATLVRWWLERYGPGTTEDIRWWLGSTLTVVRRALAAIGAVPVELEDGEPAWLAPGDTDPVEPAAPWVALLPILDQALMGTKDRAFYVGDHAARIFDSVGNGGPTAWCDGRVVGSWHQDEAGAVGLVPFEAVEPTRFADAAARVEAFCDGVQVVRPWPAAQSTSA